MAGIPAGHKGPFRLIAKALGLEGKMTATYVTPGTPLHNDLTAISLQLGPYPHGALSKKNNTKPRKEHKVRVWSPEDSSYSVLMNKSTFENDGAPKDPWGNLMTPEKPE